MLTGGQAGWCRIADMTGILVLQPYC